MNITEEQLNRKLNAKWMNGFLYGTAVGTGVFTVGLCWAILSMV